MRNLTKKYGPWGLITGASSGIGREFAVRLANSGVNVVIAARRIDRLEELAIDLEQAHGVEVRAVQADLATQSGIDAVEKAIADIDLAIVVNNAGATRPGAFLKSSVEDQLGIVRLNVTAPVQLAHLTGERLLARGAGAMIFVGSTAAFAGVPTLANYAATKAFIGTFAEGLRGEWAKSDIDVLVVHPGPTRTEMVEMEGVDFGRVPMNWMSAAKVADKAIRALGRKPVLIPGVMNKVQRFMFTRLLPRRATSRIWGTLMGRVTDDDIS